jgi:citrate synthase
MKAAKEFLTADEAAAALKVKPATLYAYASRGFIQSVKDQGSGRSLYRVYDVQRLEIQKRDGHGPKKSVGGALDLGLPVLDSHLTLIEEGKFYYRGKAVSDLVRTATLEDIARLLWDCGTVDPFKSASLPLTSPPLERQRPKVPIAPKLSTAERCMALLATTPVDESGSAWEAGAALIRLVTAAALQSKPNAQPIDQQCATAWGLDDHGRDCVRAALMLCADHELNVSSFTARCVASSRASLKAAVIAGLAALSGSRHGGATSRVETIWDEIEASSSVAVGLRRIIDRDHHVPGFWHPLYPAGDPRCTALFSIWKPDKTTRRIIKGVAMLTEQHPVIDFALVALRRGLGLPRGAAFELFAIGRTVGWIAHVLEQRKDNRLIRPRSRYVGLRPESSKISAPKNARIVKF